MPDKSKNIHIGRRIARYDLEGNFIQEYKTIREAKKEFPNVTHVLSGRAKQTKGYTFKYLD